MPPDKLLEIKSQTIVILANCKYKHHKKQNDINQDVHCLDSFARKSTVPVAKTGICVHPLYCGFATPGQLRYKISGMSVEATPYVC